MADVERIHRLDLNRAVSSLAAEPRDEPVERGLVGAGADAAGCGCPPAASISSRTSTSVRPAGCETRSRRSRSCSSAACASQLLVVRRPALVAQRVIGRDRVGLGSREPERHPAGDAGAVAAAGAVDRGRRLRVAEQGQRLRQLGAVAVGEARGTPPASTASPRRRARAADPSPDVRPEPAAASSPSFSCSRSGRRSTTSETP